MIREVERDMIGNRDLSESKKKRKGEEKERR